MIHQTSKAFMKGKGDVYVYIVKNKSQQQQHRIKSPEHKRTLLSIAGNESFNPSLRGSVRGGVQEPRSGSKVLMKRGSSKLDGSINFDADNLNQSNLNNEDRRSLDYVSMKSMISISGNSDQSNIKDDKNQSISESGDNLDKTVVAGVTTV